MRVCQSCFHHLQNLDDLTAACVDMENKIKKYVLKNGKSKNPVNMCEILPYLIENRHEDDILKNAVVAEINVEDNVKPEIINR